MRQNDSIDFRETKEYPRTEQPYSLDEVLFLMHCFVKNQSAEEAAKLVKRSPESLKYKFLLYRPINFDGSFDPTRSVNTVEESFSYTEPTVERYLFKEDNIGSVAAQIVEGILENSREEIQDAS